MSGTSKRAAERAARGLPEPPKCKAHNRDGSPCKKSPTRGATVCRMHGAGAPAVKEAARNRLAMAADGLMQTLLKIAASAESEAVRLAAVKDALDRAGFGAAHMVKLAAMQPWEEFLGEIIDDDIFEGVPAGPRARRTQRAQRRITADRDIPFPGGGSQDEDDEDQEANSRTTYNNPRTIGGHVVRTYPEPTPEQEVAAARTAQRARTAMFGSAATNAYDERSEYGEPGSTPSTDPTRPPLYVRLAMEADGEDWRAGEGGGSRRADMGL
jgi:hypothetical protein